MKISLHENRSITQLCPEFLVLNKNMNLPNNLFPRPFPTSVCIRNKLCTIQKTNKTPEQWPPSKQTTLVFCSFQPHRSQRRQKWSL